MLVVVAVAVVAGLAGGCMRGGPSCEALVAAQAWPQAAAVCRDSYERTGSAAAGTAAARSLLRSGQLEQAQDLARGLRKSDHAGDALLVLGEIAARRDDTSAAITAYHEALRAFERENTDAGASRAALGLAGAWLARGDLVKAMGASQLAIDRALHAGDLTMQLYARLGHADLLRGQGLLAPAEQELARATALARTPRDRAWVDLKHGILYVDLDLDSLARTSLERVLAVPSGSLPSEIAMAAHLNLAWIERRAGHLARAMQHVDAAAAIDAEDVDVRLNRALVFSDQDRLDDAARELSLAARAAASAHARWWVAYNEGLVAGRRGDHDGMIAAFRRSIDGVRAMSSRAGSYAPDVAASHRQPYLRLIGDHAQHAEWQAVLGLVMELEALALLSTERPPARRQVEISVEPSRVPRAPLPAVDAVVQAWRGRRLIIAISDEQTLWRLEVRDGSVTGQAVGAAADFEASARALEADPSDAAAASALGLAIVPAGIGDEVLDVLLIGAIARTPLAALAHRGHPIIDRTPLARVLGILPRVARRSRSDGSVVVLGDPRGDLPSARSEASAVAARLGLTPQLGPAATSSALDAARGAGLLHVAAHSSLDIEGPRLLLTDRAVGPSDILASGGAPAVVVLASCGGAAARDDAGWGSLAAAFIAAGADAVLASSWSVEDAATRGFVEELYRHPVREQPARALAAAQASSRNALPARIWAAFTVIAAPPQRSL